MSRELRILAFIAWVMVVSLAIADLLFSYVPIFGPLVLAAAWLPFRPRGESTRPLSKAEAWSGFIAVAVILSLLVYGAISGSTKASNEWFREHPDVRGFLCGALWILNIGFGYRAFRDKYLPPLAQQPRVGT